MRTLHSSTALSARTEQALDTPVLEVSGLSLRFGGISALEDVSLNVMPGKIVGLIGPNGAGKTSFLNCVTGLYKPTSGKVFLGGRDTTGLPAPRIAGLGLARTFQNLALCESLTVRDNVMLGGEATHSAGFVSAGLRLPSLRQREARIVAAADRALEMLSIGDIADMKAADLPHATGRRVELARAICAGPQLLLLDEPAAGLDQGEVEELVELLRMLRSSLNLTIVLVEHHMDLVMNLCEELIVLDFGRKLAQGPAADIRNDPQVIAAYLGVES